MSRKIGSIMVKDKVIICTGYNGPPRGVPHCEERYFQDENLFKELRSETRAINTKTDCPRKVLGYNSGEGLHLCIAAHAERNCIVQAARLGIRTKGATLYMDCPIPCGDCLIEIINSGIKEVVVTNLDRYDKKTSFLLDHCGVIVRKFEGIGNHEGY